MLTSSSVLCVKAACPAVSLPNATGELLRTTEHGGALNAVSKQQEFSAMEWRWRPKATNLFINHRQHNKFGVLLYGSQV